jgi:hypothetical protein
MLRLGQTRGSAPTGWEVLAFGDNLLGWDNLNVESPLADRTGWHRVVSGAQEPALVAQVLELG